MISPKSLAGIVAGVIVAAGVGMATGAGVASATESDYLYDVNNAGIGGPKGTLLSLGYQACTDKSHFVPSSESVARIIGSTQLSQHDAQFLYESAVTFLCGD